jgi:short subunit dehydrogenase-like uncharacterized protein
MSDSHWLLYGATGYTGRCIAEEAARRALEPVLAGRDSEKVDALATKLKLDKRVFDLSDAETIRQSIRGIKVLLNCAGPFSATAGPLMAACLEERVQYLDITGEIEVIEAAAALDAQAKAAGVALMPAVGFDVVPSDCLAKTLADKLPGATRLQLAIAGLSSMSPGTAKTMLEGVPKGGRARINGRIERVPLAWKTRDIPFREGTKPGMTIPWGDVASAYYSTGIPNIEVYVDASSRQIAALRRWRWMLPVLNLRPLQALGKRLIERRLTGPSAALRDTEHGSLWGRVENDEGRHVEGTLTSPNGYSLTVATALAAVDRLLRSPLPGGFLTPSLAFGADFVTKLDGCDLRVG